ncbi:dipeptidyl-peptidase-4 [Cyclobacterium lianum]|uniref:Dipeptidyl-peptidase-4 n=1 Tax=Cyclobacterium lianum TaxID=388280 RepID=A0A1M7PU60_9BACT|nr:S9 family peptidase [Cyclobacterium lianum]SHN20918.1 dipeptidyl-peptidase-4 [Cyclobacterium lianum]
MQALLKVFFFFIFLSASQVSLFAQEKQKIGLDDVIRKQTFVPQLVRGINWMRDGQFYSSLRKTEGYAQVVKINLTTGEQTDVLIDGREIGLDFSDYAFNPEESMALLASEVTPIYRRSSKASYHLLDLNTGEMRELENGEQISYASLSPDNRRVAFVKDNNLFFENLRSGEKIQVTTDGQKNAIINGSADWVYEEEFSMSKAFEWSPDGKKLAFIRFDEREVPEFNMQKWGKLYPEDYHFKYPKAGEQNARVSIWVYDIESSQTQVMDTGSETDVYLPRIYWANDSQTLAIVRLNRLQNQKDIIFSDVNSGESKVILSEKAATYVDLNFNDNFIFLPDESGFITTSEKDGFKHIYHHNMAGEQLSQITEGEWEVTALVGVDAEKARVYYISTEQSPMERHFYSIALNGKRKMLLSPESGTHNINMSPDHRFFIDTHSSVDLPPQTALYNESGELIKLLEGNQQLQEKILSYDFNEKSFFTFETLDGTSLNGYLIKPPGFDPGKTYPLLLYVYGGPGSQQVMNTWGGTRDWWHQHLASAGYLVACVDNRGTGGRGRAFKHSTYGQLGKLETQDQIAAAQYLAAEPFVDSDRIGIWGWSYGGYMSSLALMLGNETFKMAISVAPVTSWRYYDTIYTERYLKTPQLNPEGYDDYSPLSHVSKLTGKLLLIHGTGDDNVHFQNSVELVDALIAADKQFDTFYYPNRSHGISGGNTTWHLYRMMTDYIKENL